MFDCYDIKTNTCDIRCQGCCDCPIAHGLNPSRRVMKSYMTYCGKTKRQNDEFIKQLENDPVFMKRLREGLVKLHFKA
jgi:hypothetical protein